MNKVILIVISVIIFLVGFAFGAIGGSIGSTALTAETYDEISSIEQIFEECLTKGLKLESQIKDIGKVLAYHTKKRNRKEQNKAKILLKTYDERYKKLIPLMKDYQNAHELAASVKAQLRIGNIVATNKLSLLKSLNDKLRLDWKIETG